MHRPTHKAINTNMTVTRHEKYSRVNSSKIQREVEVRINNNRYDLLSQFFHERHLKSVLFVVLFKFTMSLTCSFYLERTLEN